MPTPDAPLYLGAILLESSPSVVINVDAEVVGTLNDDTLTGSARSDRMFGGDGWDALFGRGDDDIL